MIFLKIYLILNPLSLYLLYSHLLVFGLLRWFIIEQKKIKHLNTDLKNLKAEYISTRTILMTKSKRSSLIKKAYSFGLIESENPPKVIYVKHED